MAVGQFKILERPDLGGRSPRQGDPVQFVWDADHRNAPLQPWPGGVTQRTARIDYPGSDNPTEQVLGPNFKPFTLTGRWSDKFNEPGYAIKTWKAFLAMVRRGNVVQVSFKSLTFIGIITDFDWEYRRDYDIGYSFTVSVHRRPDPDELSSPPSPTITRDANTLSKAIEERIKTNMAEINEGKPSVHMAGDASPLSQEQYEEMVAASDRFQTIVNQRVLQVDSDSDLSIRRAVASADRIINLAKAQIDTAGVLKADVALAYQTPMGNLEFETWNRGIAAQARLSIFDSYEARRQLDEQADPTALALYRPFENESLYSISNRFYGTPHNWRLIMRRNRLSSSNLEGTELLVIPEAPPQ